MQVQYVSPETDLVEHDIRRGRQHGWTRAVPTDETSARSDEQYAKTENTHTHTHTSQRWYRIVIATDWSFAWFIAYAVRAVGLYVIRLLIEWSHVMTPLSCQNCGYIPRVGDGLRHVQVWTLKKTRILAADGDLFFTSKGRP